MRNTLWGAQAASLPQSAAAPTAIQIYDTTERNRFAASCREPQPSRLRSPERYRGGGGFEFFAGSSLKMVSPSFIRSSRSRAIVSR